MRTVATAIAIAITAFVFAASPAAADDPTDPSIAFPVYRPDNAQQGDTVVQLEAPGRSWGVRRSARLMDAQIDGLTIRTTGTCAANPTAVCVRVEVGSYNPAQQDAISSGATGAWQGLCICGDGARTLYFNRHASPWLDRWYKQMVAAHELGHALGLGHHTSKGAVATNYNYDHGDLSDAEAAVLSGWFAEPRYRPEAAS